MTITYYTNFSKRKNSTMQPTGGTDVTVRLKEPTSVETPTFIATTIPNGVNYIKWGSNYYYVEDIKYITNDIIEIDCSMDVLATNKSSIVGSSQFVKYYTHSNPEIVDARLSTKTKPTISKAQGNFDTFGASSSSANCGLVVTFVGEGSVGAYGMSQSALKTILDNTWIENWETELSNVESDYPYTGRFPDDIGVALQRFWANIKVFFKSAFCSSDILASIKSAHMLPISVSDIGGYENKITLGGFETNTSGYLISDRIFSDGCTISIPWQADDWRRNEPYTNVYVYIPYIGLIHLSSSELASCTTVTVHLSLDKLTGSAIFSVEGSNGALLYQGQSNVASQYPVGSSNSPLPMCENAMFGATVSAMGGNMAGVVSESFIGLANTLRANTSCIGSNSSGAGMGLNSNKCLCFTVFHDTTVAPSSISAIKGTPYNGVMNIPNSGYVECVGASVPSVAYGSEKNAINSYLNGGVYIE